jgi:predicted amidohydrolase/predicted ribosome-associated RNA-binding protein Tma20
MIEIIDLNQKPQEICRTMICQFNSSEYNWDIIDGLYFIKDDDKLNLKLRDFLSIAKQNSIDLIIFPELSIPQKQIEKLQEWSINQGTIIIAGSHYYKNNDKYIQRCPVIIKGNVFFTEKIYLSPLEKSPIITEGAKPGDKVLKFVNSFIGNFAILICSDYLNDEVKKQLDLNSIDILCVPAFQRDSEMYYRRLNIDCENSHLGIYINYVNFLDSDYGDGNSAIFGIMDKMYCEKLKKSGYTDLIPDKKVIQLTELNEYAIVDLNLRNKRPFVNRNIETSPNIQLISRNTLTLNTDIEFLKKILHDDERYKRIDELYVEPQEYNDILSILESNNIIFIIGDPGIGKTYTAVKILKEYFNKGFEPIWFAGLEKEEREIQSKALRDFEPTGNQIIYFEDPFGRTAFEKRDSLYQVFSPLMDKLKNSNSKVIVTSRKEIFETFSKESLLEKQILDFKQELNVTNPSYNEQQLKAIFDKLCCIFCDWHSNQTYLSLVYKAITKGKLSTPLAIRDLIFVSRHIDSQDTLSENIKKREKDYIRAFSLEILSTTLNTKLILYLVYLVGLKGKPFLSELYNSTSDELIKLNFDIKNLSLNVGIRSQIGYRVEQFGYNKTIYKLSHPVYEEALSNLIISDSDSEVITKAIINNLMKIDTKIAFKIINQFIFKNPDVAILLISDLLDKNNELDNSDDRCTITKNLISTYSSTDNEIYFKLACGIYPLDRLINDMNQFTALKNYFSYKSLSGQLMLCQRYINNSPIEFDSSITDSIDWEKIFTNSHNKSGGYFNHSRTLHILTLSASINPISIQSFIKKRGKNIIKKTYLFSDENDRKRLYLLLKGNSLQKEIKRYSIELEKIEVDKNESKSSLLKKVIFSDKKYYGKIYIDDGAWKVIKKNWGSLLPVGIYKIEGSFEDGTIIGVFNTKNILVAVGLSEYSSGKLDIIKQNRSENFTNLIGYYHTCSAIRPRFLKNLKQSERSVWVYQENAI